MRWSELTEFSQHSGPTMTLRGTAGKVAVLAVIFFVAAFFSWQHFNARAQQLEREFDQIVEARTMQKVTGVQDAKHVGAWLKRDMELQDDRRAANWRYPGGFDRELRYPLFSWLLFFIGLAFFFLSPRRVVWLAPVCVAIEGVAVGSLELLTDQHYPGLTLIALAVTAGLMLSIIAALGTRLLDGTNSFLLGLVGVVGAIAFTYLATALLRGFGYSIEFIHDSSEESKFIFLVILTVDTGLCLVVCQKIREAIDSGAPKYLEWTAALRIFISFIEIARAARWFLKSRSSRQWR